MIYVMITKGHSQMISMLLVLVLGEALLGRI